MEIIYRMLYAFISGGILCLIGQVLIDRTKLTPARIMVGFVVSGVVLTAVGLYDPFVKFAGTGATVPISGFGYSIAKGTEKAIAENGFMGIFTGGFTATAAGIALVIFLGVVAALISKPTKRSLK